MMRRYGMGAIAAFIVSLVVLTGALAESKERNILPDTLFPNIETFALANGMQVAVIPDARATSITHMVWYRVGSADEEDGKSGIAHFLEHLLFKGTEKFPDNAIDRTVKRVGGNHNAFTSYDYTGYFQKVTREHLRLMMEIEADRMMNVDFTPEDVDVERKVVLEERARGIETNPSAQLNAAMNLAMWKNHPYRRPIIGWRHEIEALTHQQIRDFYERYYTPANAVLVVSGNVSADEVRTLADEIYAPLQNRAPKYQPHRPSEPDDLLLRQEITVRDRQITNESVSISFRIPSFRTGKAGEYEALDMLSEILSGTTRSRIYKDFVADRQIATSAGAYAGTSARDDTEFTLYATPKGEVSLEEIEAELMGVIAKVAKEGVSEEELRRARNRLFANAIYAQDSASGLANLMGRTLVVGSTLADVRSWPDRMMAVTPETVQDVAKRFFNPETAVVGLLRRPLAEKIARQDPS